MTESTDSGAESPTPSESDSSTYAATKGALHKDDSAEGHERNTVPREDAFYSGEIAADSLRVTVATAKEIYGDALDIDAQDRRARSFTTTGPTNIGDHGVINNHIYTEQLRAPFIRDLPHVIKMVATYATTTSDTALDLALDHRSTVCLTGSIDTGRYTTACAALARRRDATQVHEILLPLNEGPECIVRHQALLSAGHGYVLRLAGGGHIQAMRLLDDVFRRTNSSLVLVKDADTRGGTGSGAEVTHHQPDAGTVFDNHLAYGLRTGTDQTPGQIEAYAEQCRRSEELQSALARTYGPREVVAIARELIRVHPNDPASLAAVLAVSQPERRARAARALLPPTIDERWPHQRTGQHERAFRIAYAAFCHHPLHDVFTSTGWLLEEIDGESRRPDLGRLALEHPISVLLGTELSADWNDAREEAAPTPGTSRTAWLRDTAMRGAIIDVAWHEFDNTRPALINWLARLVREGDKPMQAAAAEVAGLLASHDFERVHDELIDKWAISQRRDVRQAAARTAVVAAFSGEVAVLVRRKVREWVDSGSHKRDTALRVYATGLSQPSLSWNLVDLHRIAQDRQQRHSQLIAEAVNQLYMPERLGWLVAELAVWVRTGSGEAAQLAHAHAALAFLALAARGEDLGALPEMLFRISTGEVSVPDLVPLWRTALLDSHTAGQAWSRLGEWLRDADADEDLRKAMSSVLGDLAQQPPLYRRLDFFFRRMWHSHGEVPAWITTAMRG